MIVPPPVEIGAATVIFTTAVVPETKAIGVVGAMVVALAIVGAAALTALKPLSDRLVPVAAPITGVTRVGVVANTADPVPVSSVKAVCKLALLGVAKNVATPVPKPLTPVATGKPVQLVKVPLVGVPSAGVTNVELVNNNALVTCFVVPLCTIGRTSVVAAAVALGSAVIAIVAMLVVSCVNVKTLTSCYERVRHGHDVIRVVDAFQVTLAGHGNTGYLGAGFDTKLRCDLHCQVVDKRTQVARWECQISCQDGGVA